MWASSEGYAPFQYGYYPAFLSSASAMHSPYYHHLEVSSSVDSASRVDYLSSPVLPTDLDRGLHSSHEDKRYHHHRHHHHRSSDKHHHKQITTPTHAHKHTHHLPKASSPHVHFSSAPPIMISPSIDRSPFFEYSECTGRKRALCIGINYKGQANVLRGCINDAKRVRGFLINYWGYNAEDIVLLTDDSPNPRSQPTRKNMLDAMRWLVHGAQRNDSLFFHYSGHGGQTKDYDGDEIDGYDEVIYPVDFRKHGHIVDDDMHRIMVKPLPKGCRLTGLFDSCHSGTILDLPYVYGTNGRHRGHQVTEQAFAYKRTSADVISWSSCKDEQSSADTFHEGVAVGAMSHAFIKALTEHRHQTYQQLLRRVRFTQIPQLGSSHHVNTALEFVM